MKKSYLFPNYFKKIGLAIISVILLLIVLDSIKVIDADKISFKTIAVIESTHIGIAGSTDLNTESPYFKIVDCNFYTIFLVTLGIGVIFVTFSKERIEDEYISKIREQSLVWAILVNSFINILVALFVYGLPYLSFLLLINPFLLFVCYFFKFNFEIYKLKKSLRDEE
ncbi:MAG: hypothetical protein H6Q15_403 [Bacteroidetes bacterium]|nr:hypothetical protein [Bacteroidota bacterium]